MPLPYPSTNCKCNFAGRKTVVVVRDVVTIAGID
jgi:hypothetical protein